MDGRRQAHMDVLVAVPERQRFSSSSTQVNRPKSKKPRTKAGFSVLQKQQSAKQLDHHTRSNSRTDNTSNVRPHSVHQQEVLRIRLKTNLVGNPRGHRHRRYTGRANQRVDRILTELVHQLGHQNTTGRTHTKRYDTQPQNTQSLSVQELVCHQLGANRQAQKNRSDVDQGILCSVTQTFHHTALTHQITKAEHTQQRCCIRQEQNHGNQNNQRENNLFTLADRTQLRHLDGTLFLRSQRLHNGRLNHRHHSHIGVCRYRNGTQQVRSQNTGHIDRSRAISATDDTDSSRFQTGEIQNTQPVQQCGTQHRSEDTELCRST